MIIGCLDLWVGMWAIEFFIGLLIERVIVNCMILYDTHTLVHAFLSFFCACIFYYILIDWL